MTPPGGSRGSTSVSCFPLSLVVLVALAEAVLLPFVEAVSFAEPDALEAGEAVRVGFAELVSAAAEDESGDSSCRLSIMPLRAGSDGGHGHAEVRVLHRKRVARTCEK